MSKSKISTKKGQALWRRAKEIIPGGGQLLSKRSEMFLPDGWPSYYKKAKRANIWDLDGNKFIDMSIMGVGACLLGYSDPDVDGAVIRAVRSGVASTLNAPEEVELAEILCDIHPWAKMVRFARGGGEAVSIAVRIARASTERDCVAFCGYHGWTDWYLAANLADDKNLDGHLLPGLLPKGVPRNLKGTILPFHYNNIQELEQIVKIHGKNLAAIVMEPMKNNEPKDGFLEKVRSIADATGAILIFDEVTIGFKMTFGGSHLLYNVNPDIAVFAKGMSNGYAMSAVIGKKEVMQAAQETFISSTNWTERIGPAAALATLKKMKKLNVSARLQEIGKEAKKIWEEAAKKNNLNIKIKGLNPLSNFCFDYEEGQALKTIFVQEMLQKGFLATNMLFASYAHTDSDLKKYKKAVEETFLYISYVKDNGGAKKFLKGPIAHTGFSRLN